jgi:hypothetical protein
MQATKRPSCAPSVPNRFPTRVQRAVDLTRRERRDGGVGIGIESHSIPLPIVGPQNGTMLLEPALKIPLATSVEPFSCNGRRVRYRSA